MTPRFRPVKLGPKTALVERRPDGSTILSIEEPLGDYPRTLTDRLAHWAITKPDHVFLSMRHEDGSLSERSYGEVFTTAQHVGAALLKRNLSAERPLMILSENDLDNAMLLLGALHVGVPYVPVSPSYSLALQNYDKLKSLVELMEPGMIFASDGSKYGDAIRAVGNDAEIVVASNPVAGRQSTPFSQLADETDLSTVEVAHAAITPDRIAKFLFTSGTTGTPKAVIYPHLMLTSQRQQVAQTFAFTLEEPAHMVDWLPWHHTFGGTQNFGLALYSGGSLRIDIGRPTPELFKHTLQNLREVAPTIYLNTPAAFEMLVPHLKEDKQLRETFFSRVKLIYYGGAVLATHIWDALDDLATETTGERIMITSGLGCTEAGPVPASANWDPNKTALVGVPVHGVEIKAAPVEDKLEFRVKGPCVTPGYWKQPELTAAAFDADGFYKSGDAVKFIDPDHPERGLRFDGRIAENFKLTSGTWVQVADLKAATLAALGPLASDVVIAAPDKPYLSAIIFPNIANCQQFAELDSEATPETILATTVLRNEFTSRMQQLLEKSGGSSRAIQRIVLTAEPAQLETGELTDKRSISQQTVLRRRTGLVERLYAEAPDAEIIVLR